MTGRACQVCGVREGRPSDRVGAKAVDMAVIDGRGRPTCTGCWREWKSRIDAVVRGLKADREYLAQCEAIRVGGDRSPEEKE